MNKYIAVIVAAIAFAASSATHAGFVSIDTSLNPLAPMTDNQGWWTSVSPNFNNLTNDNYITGSNDTYRSFFSFDLSGVTGTVSSATFEVRRYSHAGFRPLTLGLFDVSTPAATLIVKRTGNAIQDAAIFADLGSGDSYGSFDVATGGSFDVLSFVLNANALTNINAALGAGFFSIGSAVQGAGTIFLGSNDEPGHGGPGYIQRLTMNIEPSAVPEPCSLALFGLGLAGIRFQRRRREAA